MFNRNYTWVSLADQNEKLAENDNIKGDSYELALFCAGADLPFGPILSGAFHLSPTGGSPTLEPIGMAPLKMALASVALQVLKNSTNAWQMIFYPPETDFPTLRQLAEKKKRILFFESDILFRKTAVVPDFFAINSFAGVILAFGRLMSGAKQTSGQSMPKEEVTLEQQLGKITKQNAEAKLKPGKEKSRFDDEIMRNLVKEINAWLASNITGSMSPDERDDVLNEFEAYLSEIAPGNKFEHDRARALVNGQVAMQQGQTSAKNRYINNLTQAGQNLMRYKLASANRKKSEEKGSKYDSPAAKSKAAKARKKQAPSSRSAAIDIDEVLGKI
jgi:hypothetical protein